MLQLYACGFNAWNQLEFDQCAEDEQPWSEKPSPETPEEEPYDLWLFRKVLTSKIVGIRRADFSSTLVATSSGLKLAGIPEELTRRMRYEAGFEEFVEAGNGRIVAGHVSECFKTREYKAWPDYPDHPAGEWDIGRIKQVAAGRTTFTALTAEGNVWTWGDIRFEACLGRYTSIGNNSSSSSSSSAAQPSLVTDLQSLPTGPITKIASGGFVTAALTAGHDLYLWGIDEFLRLDGRPAPLNVGDADNILDVAVGDGHAIILTAEGKVLVIGKGQNGQLGMGEGVEELREWTEVDFRLEAGWRPVQVFVGPKCSFVIASDRV